MTPADHANTIREIFRDEFIPGTHEEDTETTGRFDAALGALQAKAEERDRLADALEDITNDARMSRTMMISRARAALTHTEQP